MCLLCHKNHFQNIQRNKKQKKKKTEKEKKSETETNSLTKLATLFIKCEYN